MLSILYLAEFGLLVILLIALAIIYGTGTWPFNHPVVIRNPRDWKTETTTQDWLKPAYDYSPFNRDIPSATIACVYCSTSLDPTRCIASYPQYVAANPPNTCT